MSATWVAALEAMLDTELHEGAPDSPFRPTLLRWAAATGRPADPRPYLDVLEANEIGGRGGARRYRWSFPVARWIPREDRVAWRPAEEELADRQPDEHAGRLWDPVILVEHVEWLERLTHRRDGTLAERAGRILDEATPTLEDDVARRALGIDSWGDTFLLWAFARRPRSLSRVRGLVTAIAARYALRAGRAGGLVLGRTFPFFDTPMTSATAHLASAAVQVGDGVEQVAPAVEWLHAARRADGGWGDPGQDSDPLTTLAVAELLGILDPAFDPGSVLPAMERAMARRQGRPIAIGPEWPWVAAETLAFVRRSGLPFRDRFRWPHVPDWMRDERVQVPRYEAYLVDARLFESLPGLAGQPVEIAFVDLADFGDWNSSHGQAAGDELLALLASALKGVAGSRTIRDGGDEFLVVGAPMAVGLEGRLRDLFARWVDVSRQAIPDLPIVPLRGAITTTRAEALRTTREDLGKWIGVMKSDFPEPPESGVLERFPAYLEGRIG